MMLGARCTAIANWPRPMATNVQITHGHVAFDPKSWKAAAAPKRKPIERIGPHPVLYATTAMTAMLAATYALRCQSGVGSSHKVEQTTLMAPPPTTTVTYTQ